MPVFLGAEHSHVATATYKEGEEVQSSFVPRRKRDLVGEHTGVSKAHRLTARRVNSAIVKEFREMTEHFRPSSEVIAVVSQERSKKMVIERVR